ncbi:RING-H2 finger protein ATL39-like [Miscanthus floridulus]|uniref:RING-H2 finger protein ATL39-like n=1 Tax=Miscanthus floridulus TaxID=154761 RepID=UPI003459B93F
MPTLLSARSRGTNRGGEAADADGGAGGNRACYGIAACSVALLLFCALAVSVSLWMAFTFGGLALVAFGAAGCLARGPNRSSDGVSAQREAAGAAPRTQRRFGLPKAAINALPTFAYELSLIRGADGAEGEGGDLESGTEAAGGEPCSVCLEDVQAGEMVRQLPACKHLFHVGCIDMWLHSHRTCPVCRCNLLTPPRKVAAKAAPAPAPTAEAAEPPADEALPPV